jgi:hypothetical protein
MLRSKSLLRTTAALSSLVAWAGCSSPGDVSDDGGDDLGMTGGTPGAGAGGVAPGGAAPGGAAPGGAAPGGGTTGGSAGSFDPGGSAGVATGAGTAGIAGTGGVLAGGSGGDAGLGGSSGSDGGTMSGGAGNGGATGQGGTSGSGGKGGTAGAGAGGAGAGGKGGAGAGGKGGGGAGGAGSGGKAGSGGSGGSGSFYPCDGSTAGYNATVIKSGSTWTVTNGTQRYSGSDMQAALTAAFNSLTSGRTTKQSILVQGDGDISATAQLGVPSYTILNICGTINVTGTPSGGDRSPLYVRGRTQVDIPNAKMTGSPQYGIFIRESDNIHLGRIELRLTSSADIGIRVDSGGNASSETTFNRNFAADYVYGSGMGSHILETYGIDGIDIGTVEGNGVGESGLLLNRSINAQVDLVTCTNCGTGTGYAAFRVANDVGKVGSSYPANNIRVGRVVARGGGRGIFSVSGCGGLTIDQIDIANTGSTSILLQNTYNTTIAAVSGTVVGGVVQISNDTANTESGRYAPSQNVAIRNLTLSGGASVRQDWCSQYGANGCTATNVTGGTVSMCN